MSKNFIADRMSKIPPSGTINMFELALMFEKKGEKVIHLEVGEPEFDTPSHIKKAAVESMEKGLTHYTSSRGIYELRAAICDDLAERGCKYTPDEVLVTPGAKHAILCAILATLNPGEEVLIPTPAWPTYHVIVKMADAKPVNVPTDHLYEINLNNLEKAVNDKTKMIIINSPNNPTGGVIEKNILKGIAEIALKHDLLVLSDEIYDRLVYDGFKQVSFASLKGMKERSIIINGFSKTFAMTGWRLGYVAAEKNLIDHCLRIQQNSTTCPTSFVQTAGVAALKTKTEDLDKMVRIYEQRRKLIVDLLNELKNVSCELPKGAFYVFPEYNLPVKSEILAEKILKETKVCVTPGSVFYAENHLRLSYAVSDSDIIEALSRLKKFFNSM
ncbi:MAG: pyridoxal phosphate-dependent aminotransferase [Candidatus Odinarchaeum yellowstonii]|jgi:aminotransferase|uniref:Aminotransferase n=1 Tax=Odinarchaeota yellowstonii (strain LCB_4) TaxID=1841599 RepID=A0AAF0D2N5_ODILC|nr:MAG: pyridoxal phosphate-dependent aminotransferase [Candidatus Odinarchaeum yellowstonii]